MNSRIKPEIVNATTWSVVQHAEAESVLSKWQTLVDIVQNELMPAFKGTDNWDAFYQLVAYPTLASANLNKMYVAIGRNNLAAPKPKTPPTTGLASHAKPSPTTKSSPKPITPFRTANGCI